MGDIIIVLTEKQINKQTIIKEIIAFHLSTFPVLHSSLFLGIIKWRMNGNEWKDGVRRMLCNWLFHATKPSLAISFPRIPFPSHSGCGKAWSRESSLFSSLSFSRSVPHSHPLTHLCSSSCQWVIDLYPVCLHLMHDIVSWGPFSSANLIVCCGLRETYPDGSWTHPKTRILK